LLEVSGVGVDVRHRRGADYGAKLTEAVQALATDTARSEFEVVAGEGDGNTVLFVTPSAT